MGTCLIDDEKNEKFYFIKMIHNNIGNRHRDVYILAFQQSQIAKWDNSLNLHKQPIYIDPALENLTPSLLKKLEPRIDQAMQQLKEI